MEHKYHTIKKTLGQSLKQWFSLIDPSMIVNNYLPYLMIDWTIPSAIIEETNELPP